MGLDTPSVDADGFPRADIDADIDVYRARHLRNRLAVIRTDHKNLMKQMEQGLHHLSSSNQLNQQTDDEETKHFYVVLRDRENNQCPCIATTDKNYTAGVNISDAQVIDYSNGCELMNNYM